MNKKGFTLFQLLCVIVILALIFLITTPIINNVIKTAKLGSAKDSVYGYIRTINTQVNIGGYGLDNSLAIKIPSTNTLESITNHVELGKLNIEGVIPDYVYLTFDSSKTSVESGRFCISGYSLDYGINSGVVESSNDYCTFLEPGLYDEDDNLVASWDDLVNIYGLNYDTDYTYNTSSLTDYDKVSTSGTSVLNNVALSSGVKLIIPEGVTYLGTNVFRDNTSLKIVIFPKSLTEIGDYAFRNDSYTGSIENIIIPFNAKLERIGRTTFLGNCKIKKLFIPRSVKTIDGNAFRGGNLTTQAMGIEQIVFGHDSKLEYIGEKAFSLNTNLKEIYFPSNLKVIDEYAFQYCFGLTKLVIPASVTTIGKRAFEGYIPDATYPSGFLMNIKTLEFEANSNLEYIGEKAFYYNESLESVTIPASVKTIGASAFGVPKLKYIRFENTTGWYYTSSETATTGTSMDVSNPTTTANNIRSIWLSSWLKRN